MINILIGLLGDIMEIMNCDLSGSKKIIKQSVTHQNIGGQEFVVEGEVSFDDVMRGGNWACRNFIGRRSDSITPDLKFYYGKVGALGYIIASDEFEDSSLLNDILHELRVANGLKQRELKQQMFLIALVEEALPIDDGKKRMIHQRYMR